MDRLRLKLETKDYESVRLYAKTENFRAAVASAEAFNEQHPRSKYREEVAFILVKNSFLLSQNSIDTKKKERIEQTIERCHNFVAEFPSSGYREEVVKIQSDMEKEL
jgi:outer membrane protein assembly factor BamD